MKVCGMTYINTLNYGSCLQAYALQQYMERICGVEYDIINYSPTLRTEKVRAMKFSSRPAGISAVGFVKQKVLLPAYYAWIALRMYPFSSFSKKYCHFTNKYKSEEELYRLNEHYDAFMCGSDVVWSTEFNENLPSFFLDFAEKYKIAYAASFGRSQFSEKDVELYKKHIPAIDKISVREETAAEYVRSLGKEATVTADPTLLLTVTDWDKVLTPPKSKKPYIFVYVTFKSKVAEEIVQKLQEKTGLRVICASAKASALLKGNVRFPSPQKWIGLIKHAEYVVTNSFHGTVISTLFHKQFFTAIQGDRKRSGNVRMYDFLERLGLQDRIISTSADIDIMAVPDYDYADAKIAEIREHSDKFIKDALAEAERNRT